MPEPFIAEITEAFERAADALSRLNQIEGFASRAEPKKITLSWEDNQRGYHVINGELQTMLKERWPELVLEAIDRIGRRAADAMDKAKKYGLKT
jgi:hypothetical protein